MFQVRDDPTALARPLFEDLSGDLEKQMDAVSVMRRLLLLHTFLPPAFAHQLFNHIGGMIKNRF